MTIEGYLRQNPRARAPIKLDTDRLIALVDTKKKHMTCTTSEEHQDVVEGCPIFPHFLLLGLLRSPSFPSPFISSHLILLPCICGGQATDVLELRVRRPISGEVNGLLTHLTAESRAQLSMAIARYPPPLLRVWNGSSGTFAYVSALPLCFSLHATRSLSVSPLFMAATVALLHLFILSVGRQV